MSKLEINIEDSSEEGLREQAKRRGITLEELVRWIIGTWVIGGLVEIRQPPESMADINKAIAHMVRMSVAAAGGLSCETCTQRLKLSDVEKGCCPKCEAPID
jgi:hypothetical protein